MQKSIKMFVLLILTVGVFTGCNKKPGSVIEEFYNAKTWDEKKEYLQDVDGLKPDDVFNELAEYKVEEIKFEKKITDSISIYKVIITKELDERKVKEKLFFLVVKSNGVEKIDMKTMKLFNDVSLYDHFIHPKKTRQKFWVQVQKSQSYFEAYLRGRGMSGVEILELYSIEDDDFYYYTLVLTDDQHKIYKYASEHDGEYILIEVGKITDTDFAKYHELNHMKFISTDPLAEYR